MTNSFYASSIRTATDAAGQSFAATFWLIPESHGTGTQQQFS
jgi:hypothetical protein